MQQSLFEPSLPDELSPWLDFKPAFLTAEQAARLFHALIGELSWQQPEVVVFGKKHKIPRWQDWQSDQNITYQYSGKVLAPKAWHPEVLKIKHLLEEAVGHTFNSVLINYYRDGEDKMGWHADNEPELGPNPVVACVSLGAQRDLQFRRKKSSTSVAPSSAINVSLTNGSLLLMKAGMQRHFEHQIPARKSVDEGRISLTFRKVVS